MLQLHTRSAGCSHLRTLLALTLLLAAVALSACSPPKVQLDDEAAGSFGSAEDSVAVGGGEDAALPAGITAYQVPDDYLLDTAVDETGFTTIVFTAPDDLGGIVLIQMPEWLNLPFDALLDAAMVKLSLSTDVNNLGKQSVTFLGDEVEVHVAEGRNENDQMMRGAVLATELNDLPTLIAFSRVTDEWSDAEMQAFFASFE